MPKCSTRKKPQFLRPAYWGNYRLYDFEVRNIRWARFDDGTRPVDLAKIYQVSPCHIVNICANRRWRE